MMLCSSSPAPLGCPTPLEVVKVGPRLTLKATSRLAANNNSYVYECIFDNVKVVVKTSPGQKNFKWQARVRDELTVLRSLATHNSQKSSLIPRVVEQVQQRAELWSLCTADVGIPIQSILPVTLKQAIFIIHEVLLALQLAATANLCHGDIHPGNIVILGPSKKHLKIMVVDWELAVPPQTVRTRFTGVPHFQPTSLLSAASSLESDQLGLKHTITHNDDIESCAYLLLFLLQSGLPWASCDSFEAIVKRRQEFESDEDAYTKLMQIAVCYVY